MFEESDRKKDSAKSKREEKSMMDKVVASVGQRKSKEEIDKSQMLIMELTRYGASSRFGDYLSQNGFKLTPSQLKKLTIEELEEQKSRVTLCVANKGEESIVTAGVMFGINVIEKCYSTPCYQGTIRSARFVSGNSKQ